MFVWKRLLLMFHLENVMTFKRMLIYTIVISTLASLTLKTTQCAMKMIY